jgi:hypothetical protein
MLYIYVKIRYNRNLPFFAKYFVTKQGPPSRRLRVKKAEPPGASQRDGNGVPYLTATACDVTTRQFLRVFFYFIYETWGK